MEEALGIIKKIIEEHKVISQQARDLEQSANDAGVLLELE